MSAELRREYYIGEDDKSFVQEMAEGRNPELPGFSVVGVPHEVVAWWKKWRRSFQYYVEGRGITDEACLQSMLLHFAGPAVQDLSETVKEDSDEGNVFKSAGLALNMYFKHMPCVLGHPNHKSIGVIY